jgi:small conductance mechanosensitive channel
MALAAAAAGFGDIVGESTLIVAALTLAVGFAAQDVISNFVADVIDDIGFRLTRGSNLRQRTITVPNTQLTTEAVTNR